MEELFRDQSHLRPVLKGAAPLRSADGSTLLTEETSILQRWAEHLQSVLNRSPTISDAAIARLPAVQQLSSREASGSDATPAEIYRHGGPQLMDRLTAIIQEVWRQEEVLLDFKDVTIFHLYKRKGNRQLSDNHRDISQMNIALKMFARINLIHLNNHLEQGILPENQCGFRRHRGTTEMTFAAYKLQKWC
nr:unnamed protein product [Spirometra erinaceieuropaei]